MNNLLTLNSVPMSAQFPIAESKAVASDNIQSKQIVNEDGMAGFVDILNSQVNIIDFLTDSEAQVNVVRQNLVPQDGNILPLPQGFGSITPVSVATDGESSLIAPALGQASLSAATNLSEELLSQSQSIVTTDKRQIPSTNPPSDIVMPLVDSRTKKEAIVATVADRNELNNSVDGLKNNEPGNIHQPSREMLNLLQHMSLTDKLSQKNTLLPIYQAIKHNSPDSVLSIDSPTTMNPNLLSLYQADTVKPITLLFNALPDSSQWTSEFTDKVRWLIGNNIKQAELQLNPRELGKIDIKINLHTDQTTISITTHNPATRDLIESSTMKLKEMLEQSLQSNINVDVKQHSQQNNQNASIPQQLKEHQFSSENAELTTVAKVIESNSLIDLYA